ncbi:MAG: DUF2815 family protein [Eubacterium sp.]|nr:DUF2815 family protein [Eubacterium sp.]
MADLILFSIASMDRKSPPSENAKSPESGGEARDAHTLAAVKLKAYLGIPVPDPREDMPHYNEEMEEAAERYKNFVIEQIEAAGRNADPIVMIEKKVDLSGYAEGLSGTPDCVIITEEHLHIIEFHYGAGEKASAGDENSVNAEIAGYALGVIGMYDGIYGFETVTMTIVQPRIDNLSSVTVDKEDLLRWGEEVLKPALRLAKLERIIGREYMHGKPAGGKNNTEKAAEVRTRVEDPKGKKRRIKMKNEEVRTKVKTGLTRWSYVSVWEPQAVEEDRAKYSVSVIIPKSDTKTIQAIRDAIRAAYEDGEAKLRGNEKTVPPMEQIKTPLRDGDLERPEDDAYQDSYFVNAKSFMAPGIVDANRKPILDHAEVYSGVYGRVSMTFYAYNTGTARGIACGLNNLQKLMDGEALGGRISAEEDFDDGFTMEEYDFLT